MKTENYGTGSSSWNMVAINHDHIHGYLQWVGPAKRGFSTTDLTYFDVPLKKPVVAIYKGKVGISEILDYLVCEDEWDLENSDFIQKIIEDKYGYQVGGWQIIKKAHPNIEFKGRYGSTSDMIKYVTKQNRVGRSNFDFKYLLKSNKKRRTNKDKEEQDLVDYVWDWQQENPNITYQEVIKNIRQNKYLNNCYGNNFINLDRYIRTICKSKPKAKPQPNYDLIFWIPLELKKWIDDYEEYLQKKANGENVSIQRYFNYWKNSLW